MSVIRNSYFVIRHMSQPQNYISLAEAGRASGYTAEYLRQLCVKGKLDGEKIGKSWVTTQAAVDAFARQQQSLPLTFAQIAGTSLSAYSKLQKWAAISAALAIFLPVAGNLTHLEDHLASLKDHTHQVIVSAQNTLNRRVSEYIRKQIRELGITPPAGEAGNYESGAVAGTALDGDVFASDRSNTGLNSAVAKQSPEEIALPASPDASRGGSSRSDHPNSSFVTRNSDPSVSQGTVLGESISNEQVIEALRVVIFNDGLPEDLKVALKGEKGEKGEMGATSQYIPNSGSVFSVTAPTAVSQNVGTIGSASYLSAKDFSTETINVRNSFVQQSGTAEFQKLTVAQTLSVTGSISITGTISARDLNPEADNTYALGTSALRWSDLHLGPASLNIYSTAGTAGATADYTLGNIGFSSDALNIVTSNAGAGVGGQINLTSAYPLGNTTSSAFNFTTSTNLGASDELLQIGDSGGTFLTMLGNGNVGIGTTVPGHRVEIAAGAQNSGTAALKVSGTLGTANGEQNGGQFEITGNGSSNSWDGRAITARLLAGYTGIGYTTAILGTNESAGTSTAAAIDGAGNVGIGGRARGTTTGANVGVFGYGSNGNVNYGIAGLATLAKDSATNIAVHGLALNTGTSPIQIGGYFGLQNTVPTYESAALIADNGAQTSPIFLARDAGSTVFSIIDGGGVVMAGTAAGITFSGTGNHDITASSGTLRIGSNTIIGNIQALDDTVDIGTPATRFDIIYANEVNATTLVGTITGGNSTAETFSLNSDNATADTEDSFLAFERGSVSPNALLQWDSASDLFDFNSNLRITGTIADPSIIFNSATAGDTDFWAGVIDDAGADDDDLFQIGDGTTPGTNPFLTINTSGNVGIGTTAPGYKLIVVGNSAFQLDGAGRQETITLANYNGANNDEATVLFFGKSATGVEYRLASVGGLVEDNGNSVRDGALVFRTSDREVMNEGMRINSNGMVGINTTAPTSNFQVAQRTAGPGLVTTTASGTGVVGSATKFLNTFKVGDTITVNGETRTIATIVSDISLTTDAWTGANSGIAYTLVGGTSFSVLGNGNIGVGVTNPASRLTVVKTANDTVSVANSAAWIGDQAFNTGLVIQSSLSSPYGVALQSMGSTGTTYPLVLQPNGGNVGIGTTNPGHLLTVGSYETPVVTTAKVGIYDTAPYLILRDTDSDVEVIVGADGNGQFGTATNHAVTFYTNNTGRATISAALGNWNIAPGVASSGNSSLFTITGPAHTGLSGETIDIAFNLNRDVTFATGALATQRAVVVNAPTYAFAGASTLTDAATLAISGAPIKGTNATLTNTHGLLIQAGAVSTATNAYGLTVNAPTGATNNYAAAFLGGNVGIGTTNPGALLHVSSSLAPAGGAESSLQSLTFTAASTNTSGSANINGLSISPTQNSAGAGGTHQIFGLRVNTIAGSPGAGTQNNYGVRIDSQGLSGSETSYGLYVAQQTGSTNNYGAVFAGTDFNSSQVIIGNTAAVAVDGAASGGALEVHSNGNNLVTYRYSADNGGPSIVGAKSRSGTTGTVGTIVQNNDNLFSLFAVGDDGTDLASRAAAIQFQVDGTPGLNDMPGRITFSTTADGASSVTERMRIDSAGNVGIGATPTSFLYVRKDQDAETAFQFLNDNNTSSASALLNLAVGGSTAGDPYMRYTIANSTRSYAVGIDNSDSDKFKISTQAGSSAVLGTSDLLTIDTSGNVGIGTTGPGGLLHLHTATGVTNDFRMSDADVAHGMTSLVPTNVYGILQHSGSSEGGLEIFGLSAQDRSGIVLSAVNGSTGTLTAAAMTIDLYKKTGTTRTAITGSDVGFQVRAGTSPLMTVLGSGNVGIGTTAPSYPLDIVRDQADASVRITSYGDALRFRSRLARGTLALPTAVINTSVIGGLVAGGYGATGFFDEKASLLLSAGGTWTDTSTPTYITFLTTPSGSITPAERVRIDSAGNVGIGTTAPSDKLNIHEGALDFTHASVAHGITDWAPTNVGGRIENPGVDGGLSILGISDDGGEAGARIYGIVGVADPTDTTPGVVLIGAKKGGTVPDVLGNAETVFQLRNYTTNLMTVLGSGNVGIGTTSVASGYKFEVAGSAKFTSGGITVGDDGLIRSPGTFFMNSSNIVAIMAGNSTGDATAFGIQKYDNNAEFFTITGTGLVGIGAGYPLGQPTSKLEVRTAGLGVTQTTSSGLALVNTTAAAAGAQQISPAIRWSGFGWKTDATAASQAVDFRSYVVPVQGTANPTGYLTFESSINAGAYTAGQMVLTSAGNVGIGTTNPGARIDIDIPNASSITSEIISLRSSATTQTLTDGTTIASWLANQFIAPTLNGVAAGGTETVTNAATLYIDAAPTGSNITITNPYALWVDAGNVRFDGEFTASRVNKTVVVDGITYAQTCAGINAAIDALGASAGEVYLPEGTYTCAETITIDQNDTTIRGSGYKTIISSAGNNIAYVIDLNGKDELTFKDFKIIGNAGGTGSPGDGIGTSVVQVQDILIDHVWVASADGVGIQINRGDRVKIVNSRVSSSDSYGIHFSNGFGDNNVISNNNISNNGSYGIHMINNSGTITGNTISSNSDSGMFISTSGEAISITGNKLTSNTNYGIQIASCSQNCSITGNATEGNSDYGMIIGSGGAEGVTISGNTSKNEGTGGFLIKRLDQAVITGNLISDDGTATYGIRLFEDGSTTMKGVSIVGNTIEGFTGASAKAIELDGADATNNSINNTLITNNVIRNNTTGIVLDQFSFDTRIADNSFDTNTTNITDNSSVRTSLMTSLNGFFGIDTTAPASKLDILSTGTFAAAGVSGITQRAHTVTLSGADPTTYATFYGAQIGAMTLVGTNINQTVTDAAGLIVANPIKSTNVALTNTHGILVPATAVSTATNSYGLTVNASTGATNNYAAAFLGGNVGIGTTAPSSKLTVTSTSAGAETVPLLLQNNDSSDGTAASLGFSPYVSNTIVSKIMSSHDGTADYSLRFYNWDASTSLTERMRISGTGNVGIGNTAPQGSLHIGSVLANAPDAGADNLVISQASGEGGLTISTANNNIGRIYFADPEADYAGHISYNHSTDSLAIGAGGGGATNIFISSTGNVLLNDSANADTTQGLTINQGASDDQILALKSSDIAHGLTTLAETDTFAAWQKNSATGGGLQLTAITDTTTDQPLSIRGVFGADPTDTIPAIKFIGAKSNGTTGIADLGAPETIFQVFNNDDVLPALSILGNGNVGLGIAGPATTLDVQAAAANARFVSTTGTNAAYQASINGTGSLYVGVESSTGASVLGSGAAYDGFIGTAHATGLRLETNNVTHMYINSTGYIGIGTASPASKLDILPTATFAAAGVSGITQRAHTVTLSGADPTTYATFYGAQIGAMTLAGTNINQTVTDAAGLIVANPIKSTNVALTNTHGILIPVTAVSTATNSYGLTVNTPTGATNNYAAAFLGGNVGIGTTNPVFPLEVQAATGRVQITSTTGTNGVVLGFANTGNNGYLAVEGSSAGALLPGSSAYDTILYASTLSTNKNIHFGTANTARMTILGTGEVGIGRTDPSQKLDINTTDTVGQFGLILSAPSTTYGLKLATSEMEMLRPNGSGAGLVFRTKIQTSGSFAAGGGYFAWETGDTSPTEKMRLTKDGNVGINTTVPQSLLDVQGPVGTGATSAGILTLSTKELTIIDDDQLGRINFNSPLESDGSDAILAGAGIWAEAEATFSATVNSTALVFGTATTSAAVERMRIESSGNVGIGTTDPINPLDVVGIISSSDVAGGSPRIAWRQGSTLGGADNNYAEILIDGAGGTDDVLFRTYYSSVYHNIWQVPRDTENFIVPSGNVGIGTSVPASKLDILSTGTFAAAGVSGITQRAHTITLSGADPTTYATFYGAQIGAVTLVGTNINQTVTDAAGLIVANPIKSTNVALTNTHGILIPATAVSTATNSYGLTVNASTGATNNYAAAFLGGNVGIGTTNPAQLLHVYSSSTTTRAVSRTQGLVTQAANTDYAKISLMGASSIEAGIVAQYDHATSAYSKLLFQTDGAAGTGTRMTIDSAGLVGIGTTTPGTKLHLSLGADVTGEAFRIGAAATAATRFSITVDGTNTDVNAATGNNLRLGTSGAGSGVLTILNGGNVGIGTTAPASKLDILSTGTFAAAGVSGITQRAHTVTLSGADPTTYATFYGAQIGAMTLVGTNANQTVTDAAGLIVANPIKSTNVAITNSHGILVPVTAVSTATNAYGLTVNTPTGAGANYAAAFLGGNVGIGSTSPRGKLDVDSSGDIWLADSGTNASGAFYAVGNIYMVPISGGDITYLQARRSDSSGTTALRLRTYNAGVLTEAMHITGAGNVGIGETSPTTGKLVINQTDAANLEGIYINTEESTDAQSVFSIESDSTVGSGVDTVHFKITADGSVYSDANVYSTPADVAEMYYTQGSPQPGEVVEMVATSSNDDGFAVAPATGAHTLIGVISTAPGPVMNYDWKNPGKLALQKPVALVGRVPVKVSEENGQIHAGDRLTVSSQLPGYAAKMTESGQSIGIALEDSQGGTEGLDSVLVFVNLGYQHIDVAQDLSGQLISLAQDLDGNGHAFVNVKSIAGLQGKWSIGEDGTIVAVRLCLEDVCIDKNQLQTLLQNAGLNSQTTDNSEQGTVSGDSTSGGEETPPAEEPPVEESQPSSDASASVETTDGQAGGQAGSQTGDSETSSELPSGEDVTPSADSGTPPPADLPAGEAGEPVAP